MRFNALHASFAGARKSVRGTRQWFKRRLKKEFGRVRNYEKFRRSNARNAATWQ